VDVRVAGVEERAGPAGGRQAVDAGRVRGLGVVAFPAGPRSAVVVRPAPVGPRKHHAVPSAGRRRRRRRRTRVPAPGDGQSVDGTALRVLRGRRTDNRRGDEIRGGRTNFPVERRDRSSRQRQRPRRVCWRVRDGGRLLGRSVPD